LAGTTRLELANQLIENQPAFHFAFIPMVHMRVERFELVTVLILSQPPLPLGLHAQSWYRWRDSNPHCLVSKTSASFQLGYTGISWSRR
jgi:hypothetical protein